jgi:hypothetical protein
MAFHSTQQSRQQNPAPSIPALPNEVWRAVFSQLPNPINTNGRWPPRNRVTEKDRLLLQPVLVLRQVCRLFRTIANDLSFWLAAEFDPVSLISNFEGGSDLPGPKDQFVKALLSDRDLLRNFEKKTSWTFSKFSIFNIVSETVPGFRKNVIELAFLCRRNGKWFDQLGAPRDWVVDKVLTNYPKLQSLSMEAVEGIALSLISEKCPELSVLRVSSAPARGLIDGSLSRFCNLRELALDGLDRLKYGVEPYALPISSAETLEVLKIHRIPLVPFDVDSLHLFTNLSSLSISPCEESDFDAIIVSSFNLTALDVAVLGDRVSLNKIIAMILSPAVKGVMKFKFVMGDLLWQQEWTEEAYDRFLFAISSNCQSLHTIILVMPFRRVCFRHFGRLLNIKKVSWTGRLLDVKDTGNYAVSRGIAQAAVEDAFTEFERKPVCETTVLEHRARVPVRRINNWQSTSWGRNSSNTNPMRSARNGKC